MIDGQIDVLHRFFSSFRWTCWCWPEWWPSPSPQPGGGPSCWPPVPQKRPTSKWGTHHREAPFVLSLKRFRQASGPLCRHASNNKAAGRFYIGFVILKRARLIYQSRWMHTFERMALVLFKTCFSLGRLLMLENISVLKRHYQYSWANFWCCSLTVLF